jgi:hypothetical protein
MSAGQRSIACPTECLHPVEDTIPQTGVPSMKRPRIMVTSCSVTVISLDGRWNMWVSGRYQSTSAINAATSISGRPRLMSRATGRNPARRMNGSFRSSHYRGLCVRILSGFKCCRTQQLYKNISPMRLKN